MKSFHNITYTLCFCLLDQHVLMLKRNKSPDPGLLNGLGGKIEQDESPRQSIIREVLEEANIDLRRARSLQWKGLLTWAKPGIATTIGGSHLFIAQLNPNVNSITDQVINTPEGELAWYPLSEITDSNNTAVISNVPLFLPKLLADKQAAHYHFDYDASNAIVKHTVSQGMLSDAGVVISD